MNYNNNYKNPSVSKSFNNFNKKINLHKTELNSTPQDNLFPSFSYINGGRFLALFLWPTCQECNDYCNCDWFKELIKNNLYLRFCKHPVYGWYNRFIKIECKRDVCSYSIYKIKDSFDVDWFDKRIDYLYNLTQQLTTTGLDNFYELLTKGLTKENWNNFSNNLDNYVKEINKPKLDLISALNSSSNIISDSKNKTIEFDSSKLELIKPEIIIQKTEEIIEEIEVIQLGNGSSKNEPKEQNKSDELWIKASEITYENIIKRYFKDTTKGFITLTFDEKKIAKEFPNIKKIANFKDYKVSRKLVKEFIKKFGLEVYMAILEHQKNKNKTPHYQIFAVIKPCGSKCKLLINDRESRVCKGCTNNVKALWKFGRVEVRSIVDFKKFFKEYAFKELKKPADYSKKVIVPKSFKSEFLATIRNLKRKIYINKIKEFTNSDVANQILSVKADRKKELNIKNYLDNKSERNAKRSYQRWVDELKLLLSEEELSDKKQARIIKLNKFIEEYKLSFGIK